MRDLEVRQQDTACDKRLAHSVRSQLNANQGPWRIMFGTGAACLLGVLFLLQELLRTLVGTLAIDAGTKNGVAGTGWLHMSGAAIPAAWLYFASHVWVVAFLILWSRHATLSRSDWALFASMALGTASVHALVLGPFRGWVIRPFLL